MARFSWTTFSCLFLVIMAGQPSSNTECCHALEIRRHFCALFLAAVKFLWTCINNFVILLLGFGSKSSNATYVSINVVQKRQLVKWPYALILYCVFAYFWSAGYVKCRWKGAMIYCCSVQFCLSVFFFWPRRGWACLQSIKFFSAALVYFQSDFLTMHLSALP